ncbi:MULTISPECIES: class I SAM-dependent methyltransferase [unclassified Bradyrhizobium]|uniref:class I SAM-dependent methyltransferase n=1 Tax=unclassified Bradyrhizobium TaxID=2631580 RepID=UPI001FFBC9EA|nr:MULTISPECIES: class I SAM-dependent methyltransferase [unclassified Bradyrhizobium]MCK1707676.1 class I SAM-dependent methyltransferase [Bradyrhizobium sp. 143]MCK1731748.1 class I SAM-dependent methyltransferase [Bradyrhizobium sp. 142]
MRNRDAWKETKYVSRNGNLVASSDPKEVSVASRLMASLIAANFLPALKTHASGRLLDLGCGKVPLYGTYKGLVTGITCVDWGNSLHETSYLDKEVDLTKPIDFPNSAFDTIILSDVLEHIPVPLELCREIARLLSPGGKLLVSVPFYYPLHEAPFDFYRYTEFALRRLMVESGMKVVSLEPLGGSVEILADILSKNIMSLPIFGSSCAKLLQAVAWQFARTGLGKRLATKTSAQFPLGYFMVATR